MWTCCMSNISRSESHAVTPYPADLCGGTLNHLTSLTFLHEDVSTARLTGLESITSLMSQICACQFFKMDLMVRICQLLLTHFLYTDTDVLQQPGAPASLSCPSRNQRVWPTSHICMQTSLLSMRKHLSCLLDPNCLQVFALQGVLLP